MAKKETKDTKSAAKEAVKQQQAPKTEQPKNTHEGVIEDVIKNTKIIRGLSQDSKVTLAALTHDRYIKNPQMQYPDFFIEGANIVTDALIADALVTEIAQGSSVVAGIIARDEKKYNAIAAMLQAQGIKMPEFKSLPAPTAEQLKSAGVALLPSETVLVTVEQKNVPKEVKEKKKKEITVSKKQRLDPTKIENEEQLKEQLTQCFLNAEAPTIRILNAINFYKTYLTFKAKKSGSEDEAKKVADMSNVDLLREVVDIVGECTFAMSGIAHFLCKATNETKSPISAFCMFKKAANSAGKRADLDDQTMADMVKILVIWNCNTKISEYNKLIAQCDKNIATLSKDKKKNAGAIKIEQASKTNCESEIIGYQSIIDCINQPSFDIVTELAENYDGDEEALKTKNARRIVSNLIKTFYNESIDAYTKASVLEVATQHAGIITNMFCNPLEQNANYAEKTISELVKKEDGEHADEKPAEEQPAKEEGEESKN